MVTEPLAALGAERSLLHRWLARQGRPPPETAYERIASEACTGVAPQPAACATFSARWLYDYPQSAKREAAMVGFREHPVLQGPLRPDFLQSLAALYGPGAFPPAQSPNPDQARHFTNLYISYYQSGVPFSRDALAGVWSRCRDGTAKRTRCEKALARFESRIGLLRSAAQRDEARPGRG
jgi:hypothetical protein